ncbi:peroxiredoxin Q/BCP [Arthrobacter silviterrae]|uniref:thioredoxin-dependent peroxiredoxin n=1 Tax=Arthrobacter silviterrae TaxID=2026658 RepID=A0ABX0DEV2_9MICC|nr:MULTISPECIES: thioredoxin-dependent thiol peroxidase [Arthrobacter]MCU6482302.1 thioredoxin-dependent thiol peroxidase [Arthrobacter sp. A2-55]MDQ0278104.1 peroxiredoxin Q/BCP [Arthrobacter silviterrae]NGN85439.1 thioredoxin-dependent thiol peroxidase [Arthrobacter silviterrae]
MSAQLTAGVPAPAFSLPNASGDQVSLADYAGRQVVVYFYPKAATPGCTTEACDFRDNLAALKGAGVEVVGISTDPQPDLAKFAADFGLNFPLLSDADHATAEEWGAWGEKKVNGTTLIGTLRSTVVVNADGTVRSAEYNVNAEGHVARLRGELGL